jgi:DHA1 family bicyclomycin/chloramphenicol resistance-like MFS transporter
MTATDGAGQGIRRLSVPEFTVLLAMLFATIAFSIDAMLPALPEIAAELTPADPNRAQLILTAFVLGMGAGTLIAGPVSDAIGRKSTILAGFSLYVLGAWLAHDAQTLDLLLAARVLQGLGAAAPRIVGVALVRDLYSGREMARISSFVMMVFILVPAVAPLIGQAIIGVWGWRAIYLAFILFALAGALWLTLRQPETLARADRRALSAAALSAGFAEVLRDRTAMICTAVLTLGFGQMFGLLSSIQQIFDIRFGIGDQFPLWFMGIAVVSGAASILNARLVVRVGMRRLATRAYLAQAVFSLVMIALTALNLLPGVLAFAGFYAWAVSIFFMAGLTFGNLQALALQKMGHIAGMAASVVTSVATVGAVAIAAPVGLMFDGTPIPAIGGAVLCSALAWALMRRLRD